MIIRAVVGVRRLWCMIKKTLRGQELKLKLTNGKYLEYEIFFEINNNLIN